jgi:hypothetical protein
MQGRQMRPEVGRGPEEVEDCGALNFLLVVNVLLEVAPYLQASVLWANPVTVRRHFHTLSLFASLLKQIKQTNRALLTSYHCHHTRKAVLICPLRLHMCQSCRKSKVFSDLFKPWRGRQLCSPNENFSQISEKLVG